MGIEPTLTPTPRVHVTTTPCPEKMPGEGFEPSRSYLHSPLKAARLPNSATRAQNEGCGTCSVPLKGTGCPEPFTGSGLFINYQLSPINYKFVPLAQICLAEGVGLEPTRA